MLCIAALVLLGAPSGDGSRAFLWRVVQACLADHAATGSAFPCLALDLSGGVERGYAVIRSPLERVHVVVTPTVRTIGIEAPRLRAADAPPYFHDAWEARRFVTEALATPPDRAGIGLAVNSRRGRSQDQLHIHVGCLRPPIRRTLAELLPSLRQAPWSPIKVLPRAPTYWAHIEPDRDLADVNVFDRVADGLSIPQSEMHDMTIVVAGLDAPSGDPAAASPGFVILARKRIPHSEDEAHGEALLDDECSSIPLR